MAVLNQAVVMFANNRRVLRWNGITSEGGASLIDLTGRIVKFGLCRLSSKTGEPNYKVPVLDFSSDDVGPQVTIPNPITGSPHVEVELLAADSAALAPKDTAYYGELEVFEGDESDPVVVATIDFLIKANVVNQ